MTLDPSESMSGPPRNLTGYGPRPPTAAWPGGAKVAVQVVANYEEGAENTPYDGQRTPETRLGEVAGGRGEAGARDLAMESMYEYGSRAGIWRLLRTFQDRRVPITVFACAVALERNPLVAEAIVAADYDICCHGWRWEEHFRMSEEQERERIASAVASIEKTTGQQPRGWYCRYGPSINTRHLLVDHGGFLYDSDSYNDDLPYWTFVSGKHHLVIPYTLDTNDVKFAPGGAIGTGDAFFSYLKDTFDVLVTEGAEVPRMMSIGLHPRLIGRPGRILGLQRFIDHALKSGNAWFCRRIEIARHWIDNHPPERQQKV